MSTFIDATRVAIVYKSPLKERFNGRNDCLMYNSIGYCCLMYLALLWVMYGESLVRFMLVETR